MRRSVAVLPRPLAVAILVVVGASACAGPAPIVVPPSGPPETTAVPALDGPPAAFAAVEGGDPVAGQLGTYSWGATGSDAPWLPGAPIRAGAGEILAVVFDRPTGLTSWSARYVPQGQDGPDRALILGQGPPPVRFALPPSGAWTVELTVVFTEAQGSASYAWAITVG